jgi:hypothetical protein
VTELPFKMLIFKHLHAIKVKLERCNRVNPFEVFKMFYYNNYFGIRLVSCYKLLQVIIQLVTYWKGVAYVPSK